MKMKDAVLKSEFKPFFRKEFLTTKDLDYSYNEQGAGAIAIATERILNGEIVAFVGFERESSPEQIKLHVKEVFFFGLVTLGHDYPALRANNTPDILGCNSHSIIPSGHPETIVLNPAVIAATIARYTKNYTDLFLAN